MVVRRAPLDADMGQREQLAAWEQAVARSGLPIAGLDAEPARARVVVAAPLGARVRGEAELVDTWLTERLPVWRVREALAAALPPGHALIDVHDVWLGEPALPGRVVASVYRVAVDVESGGPDRLAEACRTLLAAASIPRERAKGDGMVRYDLRPFIEDLTAHAADEVRMTLRHDPERGVGRPDEVLAALGTALGSPLVARDVVRERLELAPPPAAPERRPRPVRRVR